MISLYDFIFEATKTGNFSNKNFKCGSNGIEDYHYSIAVIKDLLDNKNVLLVNGKSINISMFNTKNLNDLFSKVKNLSGSYSDFNDAFNIENLKDIEIKSQSQIWNSISKPPYSKGSTDGGNAEIVVCATFNNSYDDAQIIEMCNTYNIGEVWVNSIKNTVKVMNEHWNKNDYVAVQVNGNGLDILKNIGDLTIENITTIINCYSNKKKISKTFNINVSGLYGSSKDSWNKADILLINKKNKVYNILTDKINALQISYNKTDYSTEYNGILVGLATEYIIPISLKKTPDDSAKLYTHNLGDSENLEIEGSVGELLLPKNKLKDDLSGSLYLFIPQDKENENNEVKTRNTFNASKHHSSVQFYTRASSKNKQSGNATAKIELTGKNAKGGSGFDVICKKLGITTSQSYATEDRVKQGVVEYFGWKNLPDEVSSSSNWFKKPCFTVLIGLLDKYCEFHNINSKDRNIDIITPFTMFAIGCCLGNGSYYIIK